MELAALVLQRMRGKLAGHVETPGWAASRIAARILLRRPLCSKSIKTQQSAYIELIFAYSEQ
jgi:hypothetical protein